MKAVFGFSIVLLLGVTACAKYVTLGSLPEGSTDAAVTADAGSTNTGCAALPPPSGQIIDVLPTMANQLPAIVAGAPSGATIRLADGTYVMTGSEAERRITFSTGGVTLRAASGNPDAVIIDGEYQTAEIIVILADHVTIADLTLRRAENHLIHLSGDGSQAATNALLINLRLADAAEQLVKVNPFDQTRFPDNGTVACSEFQITATGRSHVSALPTDCFTGGVLGLSVRGWTVRDNRFEGIYCERPNPAEHAIHFWQGSRDTLVERNEIVDCARGIGFGLVDSGTTRLYSDDPSVGFLDHIDGVIRNNVIHSSSATSPNHYDTGIDLAQAFGAAVVYNTVVSPALYSSIDSRFPNTTAIIRNNLTWRITQRDGASSIVDHNLENATMDLFVDAATFDYHLKATAVAAIGRGVSVSQASSDIDGDPRHDPPDIGADEHAP